MDKVNMEKSNLLINDDPCRYVYVPKFESGGSFFPKMFRRWIFAMFTAQATMVGMCLLKQGFKQAYSIMFLMVLTYAFKVCERLCGALCLPLIL